MYETRRLSFFTLSGVKQSGAALGDVVLPPWAKDDAGEFIRIHREVSAGLTKGVLLHLCKLVAGSY